MKNYIVSYAPGSSGRFLTAVLFKTVNQNNTPVILTPENSGHNERENEIEFGYYPLEKYSNLHPLLYHELKRFEKNDVIPVFTTHAFPAFNVIERRSEEFTGTRFINISYEEDDEDVLIANTIIKFTVPHIKIFNINNKNQPQFFGIRYLLSEFKKTYGYEITSDNVSTIDTIKKLCDIERKRQVKHETEIVKFKHPNNIPESFKDRTLVIKYKDIFIKTKTSYVALEQLSNFVGLVIPDKVMKSYTDYVNTQPIIINTYTPWLSKSVDNQLA
jgi:hypothetical protein